MAKRTGKIRPPADPASWEFSEEYQAEVLRQFSYDVKSVSRLQGGDDWSRIILAHLYLDHIISKMLEEELVHPEQIGLDRVSFAAKLDLCSAMGLLDSHAKGLLKRINALRNSMAHDLTFEITHADIQNIYDLSSDFERNLIDEQMVVFEKKRFPFLYVCLRTIIVSLDIRRQGIASNRNNREAAMANARRLLKELNQERSSRTEGGCAS